MAAPPELTMKTLTGKWSMNKSLQDDPDAFFSLQGLGWLMRKAIGMASVTLVLKQFEKEGAIHLDIDAIASGLSTTKEYRILDWTEREHTDRIFGQIKGKSRIYKRSEYQPADGSNYSEEDRKFLTGETLKDGSPSAFTGDDDHIQTIAVSQTDGWTVEQIWAFEDVNGERRYTRRLLCTKGGKSEKYRIVYDYVGPIES